MACLLAYCWVLVAWAYSEYLFRSSQRPASPPDPEGIPLKTLEAAENGHSDNTVTMVTVANADSPSKPPLAAAPEYNPLRAALVRCLWLDADALLLCRGALRASAECGSWVLWFYVADRTRGVEPGHKQYVRDQFAFLFIALTAVAAGYSAKPGRAAVALNRTQTEEWKGWMQVLFLLYHYFEAREVYNAIRVFIAAYVWMTGYGNFSYYYRTADFSLGRFCQMMWRLNFLVAVCCAALGNSYMLYYICPMHTLFTVFVYGVLALGAAHNRRDAWIWGKFALSLLAVAAVWEYKRVFYLLFSPLGWLLNYDDPARPSGDPMREWFFRSGLDRYVWIHGMLCAFLHPAFERGLAIVEGLGA
ncbi:Cas1p-like 10 TM acyl Transferase domain-containing protein, partial [Helicosporidium sp. ATCC 50920]